MQSTNAHPDAAEQRKTPRRVFKPGSLLYARQAATAWSMVPVSRLIGIRPQQAFGILTYHRITPRRGPAPDLNVTPKRLDQQLAGLLRLGYQPWPLRQAVQQHLAGGTIPRNVFVVVFDDGYEGVCRHALAVLQRLQVPATVFVPTGHLGAWQPCQFDDWSRTYATDDTPPETWRIVSAAQCRSLLATGLVDIGSHSHAHRDLRDDPPQFERDLRQSVAVLADLGVRQPTFAFPFGARSPQVTAAARRSGVICGLTADCQLVTPAADPFSWGRFGAEQYDTPASLAAKLNGSYSLLQNIWRSAKRAILGSGGAAVGV